MEFCLIAGNFRRRRRTARGFSPESPGACEINLCLALFLWDNKSVCCVYRRELGWRTCESMRRVAMRRDATRRVASRSASRNDNVTSSCTTITPAHLRIFSSFFSDVDNNDTSETQSVQHEMRRLRSRCLISQSGSPAFCGCFINTANLRNEITGRGYG